MRKIATLAKPVNEIRRVMTCVTDEGVYLFMYEKLEDGPCDYDDLYESLHEAERVALEQFAVDCHDWVVIDDPMPDAQHDWIRPTRVKQGPTGEKLWGQFEAISTTD
jgi:hypothetical protein